MPHGAACRSSPPGSGRHRDRPKIVALCDVSGSVARVSDFFLLLIHSLHEVVVGCPLVCVLRTPDRGQRHPGIRSPEEAMAEIMSKVGFGSSDYGNSLRRFRARMDERDYAADHRDRARRRPQQQSRSARGHPCAGSASGRSGWCGSIPRAHGLGLVAIRKCRAMRPSAPSSASAPPRSSSSARYRISWRRYQ